MRVSGPFSWREAAWRRALRRACCGGGDDAAAAVEKETSAWKQDNTKACPGCAADIQKTGGCNHMTCSHCGHEFCWICCGAWMFHFHGQCTQAPVPRGPWLGFAALFVIALLMQLLQHFGSEGGASDGFLEGFLAGLHGVGTAALFAAMAGTLLRTAAKLPPAALAFLGACLSHRFPPMARWALMRRTVLSLLRLAGTVGAVCVAHAALHVGAASTPGPLLGPYLGLAAAALHCAAVALGIAGAGALLLSRAAATCLLGVLHMNVLDTTPHHHRTTADTRHTVLSVLAVGLWAHIHVVTLALPTGGWFAAWRAVLWARWAMDCSTWAASWLLLPAASAALAVGVARSRQSASNAAGRSRTPSSARLCHALELAVLAALVLHAGRGALCGAALPGDAALRAALCPAAAADAGWFEGEALAAETAAMFARQCAAGDALWGDLGLCGADGSPGSSGGRGADLSGRAGVRLAESDDDESAAAAAALRPRNGYDTLAGAGRDFLAALARREFFTYIDFTEKEPCYGPSCRAPWLDFIAALPLLVGVLAPLAAVYGWRRYRIRSTRRLMLTNELAGLPGGRPARREALPSSAGAFPRANFEDYPFSAAQARRAAAKQAARLRKQGVRMQKRLG